MGADLEPMTCHVAQHAQHTMSRVTHAFATTTPPCFLVPTLAPSLAQHKVWVGHPRMRVWQPSGWGDVVRGGPPPRVLGPVSLTPPPLGSTTPPPLEFLSLFS